MTAFLTAAAALATWQVAVVLAPFVLIIAYVLASESRTRRHWRERDAATARTREHIARVERSRNQRVQAYPEILGKYPDHIRPAADPAPFAAEETK